MTRTIAIHLLGLLMAGCACLAQGQTCESPKIIRVSLIPKKSSDALGAEYQPLVKVLEAAVRQPVEIVMASSYGAVVEGLLAGTVDLAELGPASYAQAKARDNRITAFASMIQRVGPHTEAGDSYRSLLVVRRDKKFHGLPDLRGSNISLIDPASTSGALIPRQAIAKLTGMALEHYFGRITFAGSHDRAIQAVQKGLVDAAFVSSSRLDEAVRNGSLRADELQVLWKSSPIPYDPFVYRGQLCQPVIDKIKQAFFQNSASLQDMFRGMNGEGFAHVSDEQYRGIREVYANQP
ncbi:phosphate/phosphite/phosphonate ABC transporter substrate-binding protein [Rhodoferax sp. GW822-FHT02A01]|uniref:phosphate/phosphite/phosphonate ABC transporter substrate-binding protein n=1 Tax=Rhodoferax sp. GW822-FHT02A01 TaxID=3141537 RepID=UPI00315C894F